MKRKPNRVRDNERSSDTKLHDHTPKGLGTKAATPDEFLPVEKLMELGAAAVSEHERLNRKAKKLARTSTVALFRAGKALSLAKAKVAPRNWGKLLDEYNIPRTTAWEAIELFKRAGREEEVGGMTKADALRKFKIRPPKQAAAAAATVKGPDISDREDDEPTEGDLDNGDEDETRRKNGRKAKPSEAGDDRDDDADGDETDDEEEDLDADEESAADEDDPSEADEEEEQADESSPLVGMDQVLARLDDIESTINTTRLDDDSIEQFLVKVDDAQDQLLRLREAVELQAVEE